MLSQNSTRTKIPHLFASLLIFILIFPYYSNPTYKSKKAFQSLYETIFQIDSKQPTLNLSQVYVIYSNVFVVERSDTSEYVTIVLRGPYKQEAWLVLTSPWKPVFITSNNTNQHFNELSYDPETMSTNPISNTTYKYAWDYDPINQVVFIKLQLTSTVIVTIHYVTPGPQIHWILITLALAVISATAYLYYKRRKKSYTRQR